MFSTSLSIEKTSFLYILSLKFDIFRSFIRTFEMNLQGTCTRSDKYSSKLDIFRSFIRTFVQLFRYTINNNTYKQ